MNTTRFAFLTDEQMQRAYVDIKRAHWPPYEKALQDPLYSRIIRMHAAVGLQAQAREAQRRAEERATKRLQGVQQFLQAHPHRSESLDRKSLAAGEKEEPDA